MNSIFVANGSYFSQVFANFFKQSKTPKTLENTGFVGLFTVVSALQKKGLYLILS